MTEDEKVVWHHQLNDMSLGELWELMIDREPLHAVIHGLVESWTQLSD